MAGHQFPIGFFVILLQLAHKCKVAHAVLEMTKDWNRIMHECNAQGKHKLWS